MDKFSITVMLEGQTLKATSDGAETGAVFVGSDEHIRLVRKAIRFERMVDIAGTRQSAPVKAGYEDPLALTAALYSIALRYTRLVDAPEVVFEFFQWIRSQNGCSKFLIKEMD